MHAGLRTIAILLALAARAAGAADYQPGPKPVLGTLHHCGLGASSGSDAKDVYVGLGSPIVFWMDRKGWKDIDLVRADRNQPWREVADDVGFVVWAVDGAADVYPTVGDRVTFTAMDFASTKVSAPVYDSGRLALDRPEIPRPKVGPPALGTGPEPADTAAAMLDLEKQMKRARTTDFKALERRGEELLRRFDDRDSQGRIYYTLAKIAAESGQTNPVKTIEFAQAALERPLPDEMWIRVHVYWGDALQVLDYVRFPSRRPAAALKYLEALEEIDCYTPKPVKTGKPLFGAAPPTDPARAPAPPIMTVHDENSAHLAGWESLAEYQENQQAKQLNDRMQQHRDVVVQQLATLYRRDPPALAELESLARCLNLSGQTVRDLLAEVRRPAPEFDENGVRVNN